MVIYCFGRSPEAKNTICSNFTYSMYVYINQAGYLSTDDKSARFKQVIGILHMQTVDLQKIANHKRPLEQNLAIFTFVHI